MTYGIELRNAHGERIAGDGPITYLKAAGDCLIATDFSNYPGYINLQFSSYESFSYNARVYSQVVDGVTYPSDGTSVAFERDQWVASSFAIHPVSHGWGVPAPLTSNIDDLIYVELNENGILQAASFIMPFATLQQGKCMLVTPSPAQVGTRLKYKISSTDFPAPSGDEFGLQLFDEVGDVVFDSRFPQLPIEGFWFVTKEQVEDILDGNLTLTHTLRVPIETLYAHLPIFWSWKYIGSRFYTLHIKKISNTEVQIGRAYVGHPHSNVYGQSIRDMMIFFAK